MPRFTKDARPHLDTKRHKPKPTLPAEMQVKGSGTPAPRGSAPGTPDEYDSLVVRPLSYNEPKREVRITPGPTEDYHDEGKCMVHFDGIPNHPVTPPNIQPMSPMN